MSNSFPDLSCMPNDFLELDKMENGEASQAPTTEVSQFKMVQGTRCKDEPQHQTRPMKEKEVDLGN